LLDVALTDELLECSSGPVPIPATAPEQPITSQALETSATLSDKVEVSFMTAGMSRNRTEGNGVAIA
jgi:hypothetical protein